MTALWYSAVGWLLSVALYAGYRRGVVEPVESGRYSVAIALLISAALSTPLLLHPVRPVAVLGAVAGIVALLGSCALLAPWLRKLLGEEHPMDGDGDNRLHPPYGW